MRKFIALTLIGALLAASGVALAASKASYTLPTKGSTVLQNEPLRVITPRSPATPRAVVPGESPVTGLPWEGEYLPMLVQVANSFSTVTVNGRTVKTAGVGKASPWGMQHADIVYESVIGQFGSTRFTLLLNDCFSQGEPANGLGPVRSTRISSLLLREEWQGGFVYNGGFGGTFGWRDQLTVALFAQTGAPSQGILFDKIRGQYREAWERLQGIKAPGNISVNVIYLRSLIPETVQPAPHPFVFVDAPAYGSAYAPATVLHLDWGLQETVSHFQYDAQQQAYVRYCGTGIKPERWALFTSFASALDRSEESRQPLAFANVIFQRVQVTKESELRQPSMAPLIGQGNADVFIGGRYIPGTWVRASLADPTVFYDDQGNELMLCRGKTYIAQLPPECLGAFSAEP